MACDVALNAVFDARCFDLGLYAARFFGLPDASIGNYPNNGGEGFRFPGFPMFDAPVNWDFKHTDQTADVTPSLATSWEVDEVDHTRWISDLRHGVKFHGGTDFNADAVPFTLGRV